MEKSRINSKKAVIKNQKYESYWKSTLALTDFKGNQFIRTLIIIIEHIEKYDLANKEPEVLIKNLNSNRKVFNSEVVHNKELESKIREIYPNDDDTGASTRKQINTFIKLGFVRPYLRGFAPSAKDYVKPGTSEEKLSHIFSNIVYEYSSFGSSMTNDDTSSNQIKFLINTLINKTNKRIDFEEFVGIMQSNVHNKKYAKESELNADKKWANNIKFSDRKYNQISHLKSILSNMNLFSVVDSEEKGEFSLVLAEDSRFFTDYDGDTTRDSYRYGLMRKAVLDECEKVYGKRISWYSKLPAEGLVVSHIYASADALRKWDTDAAYDPNNALILKPGDEDQYFDKYKMTFDNNGLPIFSSDVRSDFIQESIENDYKLDSSILTKDRLYYLEKYHRTMFEKKRGA